MNKIIPSYCQAPLSCDAVLSCGLSQVTSLEMWSDECWSEFAIFSVLTLSLSIDLTHNETVEVLQL